MKYFIYKITNLDTNKSYIGIAVNVEHRMSQHKRAKSLIGESIREYGFKNHKITIIDELNCDRKQALDIEQKYIYENSSVHPSGYNVRGKNKKPIPAKDHLHHCIKNNDFKKRVNDFGDLFEKTTGLSRETGMSALTLFHNGDCQCKYKMLELDDLGIERIKKIMPYILISLSYYGHGEERNIINNIVSEKIDKGEKFL